MKTLEIEALTAKKLFRNTPEWFQKILIENFGKDYFAEKVTDRIKTFEDACDELGLNPGHEIYTGDEPHVTAYKKLVIIARAINEGWVPDWSNTNERKWYSWFRLSSGFGFSGSGYYCAHSFTSVGSRLCFQTEEKSDYVATQFIDLFKAYLTF